MAKQDGALFVLKKATVVIGGGRTVNMTVNGSPINTTDQGDAGIAKYLAGVLTGRSLEFSVDGQEEDQVLRTIAFGASSASFLTDLTFTFGNGDILAGNFVMTGYTETGAYEDAQTYTATFASDGDWTFTAA